MVGTNSKALKANGGPPAFQAGVSGFDPRQRYMIKTINAESGGLVHIHKGEPDLGGDPEKVNILHELVTPVSLTDAEADQLIQNITDVKNS